MAVVVQELVGAVDVLRGKLVAYDEVEAGVLKTKEVLKQAEELSNTARLDVLDAVAKLRVMLQDIEARYSNKPTTVREVESSHLDGDD